MGDFFLTAIVFVRSGGWLTSALVYVFVQEWLGKIWMSKPFSKKQFWDMHTQTNQCWSLLPPKTLVMFDMRVSSRWTQMAKTKTKNDIILFIWAVHSPIKTPDRPPCSVTIIRRDLSQAHPSVQWKHCEAQQQNRNKWISHCPEWYAVAKAELR